MRIYGLRSCDSCRKALKALPGAKLIDVRSEGVPGELLAEALAKFGTSLLNTRSTTWRGLDDASRARHPLDLLRDHPALMKRPLMVSGNRMLLGWNEATRKELRLS